MNRRGWLGTVVAGAAACMAPIAAVAVPRKLQSGKVSRPVATAGLQLMDDMVLVEPRGTGPNTKKTRFSSESGPELAYGTVLGVGPSLLYVFAGDEVVYTKYAGSDIVIGDRTARILRESDVLAKVDINAALRGDST